ncbi:unnamed protein product, partial [Meganyctiphanes norvegica]
HIPSFILTQDGNNHAAVQASPEQQITTRMMRYVSFVMVACLSVIYADSSSQPLEEKHHGTNLRGDMMHSDHNCVTNKLLLRHEDQLRELVSVERETVSYHKTTTNLLTQVRDALDSLSITLRNNSMASSDLATVASMAAQAVLRGGLQPESQDGCSGHFSRAGSQCLLMEMGVRLDWNSARQHCRNLSSDLAVFKDANQFAQAIHYVNSVNHEGATIGMWIGGSDEAVEGKWLWVNGQLMPRGAPFWGTHESRNILQPAGGIAQNCAFMDQSDQYYLNDHTCTFRKGALCQKLII